MLINLFAVITMQINYTVNAFTSLTQLINFIESNNTAGAGLRWLAKYELFLQKTFLAPQRITLCHNKTFNQLNLRCLYFNDWIIAFSIYEEYILIEALLHRSRINN